MSASCGGGDTGECGAALSESTFWSTQSSHSWLKVLNLSSRIMVSLLGSCARRVSRALSACLRTCMVPEPPHDTGSFVINVKCGNLWPPKTVRASVVCPERIVRVKYVILIGRDVYRHRKECCSVLVRQKNVSISLSMPQNVQQRSTQHRYVAHCTCASNPEEFHRYACHSPRQRAPLVPCLGACLPTPI